MRRALRVTQNYVFNMHTDTQRHSRRLPPPLSNVGEIDPVLTSGGAGVHNDANTSSVPARYVSTHSDGFLIKN